MADQREYVGDQTEAFNAMLDGRQSKIWTLLPGIIQSFDPAKLTAKVQVALTCKQLLSNGTQEEVEIPVLVDCPVVFPRGGGYTFTFPIKADDECEVRFSSRCIDAWWQSGGIQAQQEFRMHDLSDGFVTVGPTSQPNVIEDFFADGPELRSDDGSTYMRLNDDQEFVVVAPGGINLNGLLIDSAGNLTTPGGVQAGTGTGDSVTLQSHKHPTAALGAPSVPTPGT